MEKSAAAGANVTVESACVKPQAQGSSMVLAASVMTGSAPHIMGKFAMVRTLSCVIIPSFAIFSTVCCKTLYSFHAFFIFHHVAAANVNVLDNTG